MAKNSTKVTVTDKGAKAFLKATSKLSSSRSKPQQHVNVGIIGEQAASQHPDSDITMGDLALIHQLGLGVPARPFLTQWTNSSDTSKEMDKAFKSAAKEILSKCKGTQNASTSKVDSIIEGSLENIAELGEASLKNFIESGQVSPQTQQGNTPLLQSGAFVGAITGEVVDS